METGKEFDIAIMNYLLKLVEMNNTKLKDELDGMDRVADLYVSMAFDASSEILFLADRKMLWNELQAGHSAARWLRRQLSNSAPSDQISGSEKATP